MLWLLLLLCADSFDTSLRSGLIALNNNDLPVAESQLEAASQLHPADARVWLALAQTYFKLQRRGDADSAAMRAESLTKDSALLQALTVYYSETGNTEKTGEVVRTALSQSGLGEDYYFKLADICLKHRDFTNALESLAAGRKIFDRSPQLELAAGVAYYGLRRFPESIDAFLRTIEIDPALEQPYVFLGRMLEQAEDRLPRIREAFAGFERRAPDNYLSPFLYARSLSLGNPAQAEALLRKSIARNGQFAESQSELGAILERQGRFEEAARAMRRAIELNPNDPVPHYRLARIYDRLGKANEAKAERDQHARLVNATR
ncbi:MAG: tetratricopeptide repeat protein [Acidobacteriota bacterium]|nr:tetratricopeptide repeat protein [Acidobacteriota bacterium]